MKVIICGAGQVGYGIAERLSKEDNDVTVIDSNAELVQRVRDTLDARGVHGHGSHPDVLDLAGAGEADMLIAVTQFDEVNMTASQVAHSLFNVPMRIARIRSQSYLTPQWKGMFARDHLPIDVIISPEIEVGELILQRMTHPAAADLVSFAEDKVTVLAVDLPEDCAVIDTPLSQLTELFPNLQATVVGIRRDGVSRSASSTDQLQPGDQAIIATPSDHVTRVLSIFGRDEVPPQRIVIAGAGNIGRYVAKRLEDTKSGLRVKLIDHQRVTAQQAAEELNEAIVVFGDALQEDIQNEVDVGEADLFLALTNDDETNILSSVLASELGCKSTLALINQLQYPRFAKRLGIDAFLNPRAVTISKILRHVRRGRILGVYSLDNGDAEIIEAEALETSPLVGKTLKEIDLEDGIRVGAVIRAGEMLMPRGSTRIESGDFVILYALAEQIRKVEQLFRVSLDFF